jgi:hypothetical protein
VSYALENALFQWEEAERIVRASEPPERAQFERASARVLDGLRQRLGSEFTIQELSDLYGSQPDWNFGGGRPRQPF